MKTKLNQNILKNGISFISTTNMNYTSNFRIICDNLLVINYKRNISICWFGYSSMESLVYFSFLNSTLVTSLFYFFLVFFNTISDSLLKTRYLTFHVSLTSIKSRSFMMSTYLCHSYSDIFVKTIFFGLKIVMWHCPVQSDFSKNFSIFFCSYTPDKY